MPLRRLAFHGGEFPSGCLFHIPVINSLVKQHACTRRWHNHLSHSLCFSRDYSASTCTCRPPHTEKPPGGIANFVGGTYLCLKQRVSVLAALRQCTHCDKVRMSFQAIRRHTTPYHAAGRQQAAALRAGPSLIDVPRAHRVRRRVRRRQTTHASGVKSPRVLLLLAHGDHCRRTHDPRCALGIHITWSASMSQRY